MSSIDRTSVAESEHGHFIGGEWQAAGGETIDVVNPATAELIGRIPEASAQFADDAAFAAARAQENWGSSSIEERSALLGRIAGGIADRRQDLASMITTEVGVPVRSSGPVHVDLSAEIFLYYAGLVREFPFEEELGTSRLVHEPIGVVGAITPWNYPLYQIASKIAPALAAGCTVVLKPSELAPLNTVILGEILDEVGTPPGVVNIVFGTGEGVGEAIVSHPRIDMVSFTGSTRAGRRVSELAARRVKPVSLELGGKSPSVVTGDADLESAVVNTVAKCFANSGQNCGALSRLLVPEGLEREAVEIAAAAASEYTIGDPNDPATRLGPLISERQLRRVRGLIQQGVDEGATLAYGEYPARARSPGYFVGPHVFSGVTSRMALAQEEIFGPVLSIMSYATVDDAVAIANSTPYGLCAAVWAKDDDSALGLGRRIRAGQVDLNGAPANPLAPFGGFGASGHGRELGPYGLAEFLSPKSIQMTP